MILRALDAARDLEAALDANEAVGWHGRRGQTEFYVGRPDSTLFVAEIDGAIAGMGGATVFAGEPATAWAHGIVVRPEFQRAGIGAGLTRTAVDWSRARGARTVLLLATDAGRPVYERLGFVAGARYGAFEWPTAPSLARGDVRLRRMEPGDMAAVCTLDHLATGEHRDAFLASLATAGWVAERADGVVCGYHIACPWGGGPTIASDAAAGLELLRWSAGLQTSLPVRRLGVPEENVAAFARLASIGLQPTRYVTRMWLGPAPRVQPEMIWGVFNFAVA